MIYAATQHPSLKERQRAEREALILDEAERILAEQGYSELVMEHLAERVGIGKGTIYLHFPRKEDLVAAIMVRGMQRMIERIAGLAEGEGTATERLRAIMEVLIDGSVAWMQWVEGPIRRAMLDAVEAQGEARGRFHESFARLFETVGAVVEQGKARGEFAPDIATPVAVLLLLFTGRISNSTHFKALPALDPALMKESILRLYFDGLHVRPEQKGSRS